MFHGVNRRLLNSDRLVLPVFANVAQRVFNRNAFLLEQLGGLLQNFDELQLLLLQEVYLRVRLQVQDFAERAVSYEVFQVELLSPYEQLRFNCVLNHLSALEATEGLQNSEA